MSAGARTASRWLGLAGAGGAALGALSVSSPQASFALLLAVLGAFALSAPAGAWVACALVAATTFKGLASIHLLPSVASFADLPIAWGALVVALTRRRDRPTAVTRHLRWLAALALAAGLAWAFNPSEVLRPILYLMLLGEPFVIVLALLLDPPSARVRQVIERTLLAVVLIQIPIVAVQLVKLGAADKLQGTLYKAGAGAHVISAIVVVGAIWILAGGAAPRLPAVLRLPTVGALAVIPFLADAKQVIAALPATVLATSWRVSRLQFLLRGILVVGSVAALFMLSSSGRVTTKFLESAQHGHSGKEASATFVWHQLRGDPASIAFGKGPAETVSRAAFMTTEPGSPLVALGLKPATIAIEARNEALAATAHVGGVSSFNSGVSSTLGVVGDLGVFGLLAYTGLFLSIFLPLRTEGSAEGVAAAAGFALFLVLGSVFDWWEQPPFGVFLGTLAGLSLSTSYQARSSVGRRV